MSDSLLLALAGNSFDTLLMVIPMQRYGFEYLGLKKCVGTAI
ncbi:hypothetical protein AB994_3873 (plasmid) [Acinetobacter baumannii]|nr:hypothetical protein AB994_1955 [Acinetobacter baumannii]KMV09155.1 hypothetical protein AB994_3873 [Acinetobacter baumannii]